MTDKLSQKVDNLIVDYLSGESESEYFARALLKIGFEAARETDMYQSDRGCREYRYTLFSDLLKELEK